LDTLSQFTFSGNLPLVSAIIASHNDYSYLPDSIQSVLNQDYPHIECILVDDGSTDDTPDLVRRWSDDPRFHYIRIEHTGLSGARNKGLQHARGALVAFLDADDWWEREKTILQTAFLLSNPGVGFCWCGFTAIGNHPRPGALIRDGVFESTALAKHILLSGVAAAPSCWMVRRNLLMEAGGFDEAVHNGSDRELMFRLACNSNGGCVAKSLTVRLLRDDSMSRNIEQKMRTGPKVIEKMLGYNPDTFSVYRCEAMHNLHRYLASHAWIHQAWGLSILEALRAAYWKPSYAFALEFWQNILIQPCFVKSLRKGFGNIL
jgi:glycosyltransferase involved in cell wall biosynthesis